MDYLPGILIAALGIAVNVYLFMEQRSRQRSLWEEYQTDYGSSLTNPGMKYYADWNLVHHHISQYVLYFIIFCAAVYLLQMILPKIRLLSVLIPIADLALWGIALWCQRGMENRDAKWMLLAMLLSVLVFWLVWVAVFTRKTRFAVLGFLAALGYCAFALLFHGIDTKAATELAVGNSAGNALLLMCLMISDGIIYGVPRRKKENAFREAPRSRGRYEEEAYGVPSGAGTDPGAGVEPAGSAAAAEPAGISVPASRSHAPAASGFLAQQDYVIDEKVRPFGTTKVFKIYDLSGEMTGYVREQASGGAKTARAFLGKGISGLQAVTYEILDSRDTLQFLVAKKGGIGTASIFDADGSMMAELSKGVLINAAGNKLGKVKSSLSLKTNLSVLDPAEREIGKISKKWNGVMKTMFSTADKYFVSTEHGISREQKILVLGTALIYEMILGNH